MHIDPQNAVTWTVVSQTTRMERRLLTLLGWLGVFARRRQT